MPKATANLGRHRAVSRVGDSCPARGQVDPRLRGNDWSVGIRSQQGFELFRSPLSPHLNHWTFLPRARYDLWRRVLRAGLGSGRDGRTLRRGLPGSEPTPVRERLAPTPPSVARTRIDHVLCELVKYLFGGRLPAAVRRIIVDALISLDGYLSDSNGEIDWFTQEEDFNEAEGKAWSLEMLRRADTILFGRVTFDGMAEWWPSETARKVMPEIAGHLNGTPKIVFSRTLKTTTWENTTILPEASKEVVLELKQRPGRDLLILASSSLVSAFMRDGLIDEYWIRVVPVVLGAGRPLFKDQRDRHKLRLVSCRAFRSGVVALRYEPKP